MRSWVPGDDEKGKLLKNKVFPARLDAEVAMAVMQEAMGADLLSSLEPIEAAKINPPPPPPPPP